MLVFFGNGVVLVAGGVGDFVEPAGVELISQVRHPWGWDFSLVHHLPVHSFEPLVLFHRLSVLSKLRNYVMDSDPVFDFRVE